MRRAYVVWDPEHGTVDKNSTADKQVPVHKIKIVEAESPKRAIRAVARDFLSADNDITLHAVLASDLGSYNAKIAKYTVYFHRVVWRVMRSE